MIGLDELDRFFCVFSGEATSVLIVKETRTSEAAYKRVDGFAGFGRGAGHVIGVGDAKVVIEAVMDREEGSLIPKVPLADAGGGVTEFTQVVCDCVLFGIESSRACGEKDSGNGDSWCVTACHQLCARGRANGCGVETGQLHAFLGHAVEVGCAI